MFNILFATLLARLVSHVFLKSQKRENFTRIGNKFIYTGREEDNTSFSAVSDRLTIGSTFTDGVFLILIGLSIEGVLLWFVITHLFLLPFIITGLPVIIIGIRIVVLARKDWKTLLKSEDGVIKEIFIPKPKRFIDHIFGFTVPGPLIKLDSGTEVSVYGIGDKLQVGSRIRISYTPHLRYWREVEVVRKS